MVFLILCVLFSVGQVRRCRPNVMRGFIANASLVRLAAAWTDELVAAYLSACWPMLPHAASPACWLPCGCSRAENLGHALAVSGYTRRK
ncbi:hypothetical protein B0J12DRAFT_661388 [Macrophomina phaseolina]|uniref:Secreted protein n=1 Tax=Macrophomina phaseolina TaxID=35725 RepID=A0ABQ8GDI3_9PEZI|nr:hypothetical protein B0J12DRAFT_661388 [Macrophomina phaseolina]